MGMKEGIKHKTQNHQQQGHGMDAVSYIPNNVFCLLKTDTSYETSPAVFFSSHLKFEDKMLLVTLLGNVIKTFLRWESKPGCGAGKQC